MEKIKLFCVSLGCDKNLVDTEKMLGVAGGLGVSFTDDETEADAILINTCCFIGDAKEESVNTILEMARYKEEGKCRALIVAGCLAQRYKQEIIDEIPEVDAILGTTSYEEIGNVLTRLFGEEKEKKEEHISCFHDLKELPETAKKRVMTTGGHYAFLKIAEGCDKRCSYCIIPYLRGPYRSVPMEQLLAEARELAENGVRELILVAQETTLYGKDLYGEKTLPKLLHELAQIPGIYWIRIQYCYPEEITDELIQAIKTEEKVCHYLDIPIQHASDRILKDIAGRMKVVEADSVECMSKLLDPVDVIYLDPMFPARQKSSLINKKLQLIQKLEPPCSEETDLFDAALKVGPSRIIVKRPLKSECLAGREPSYTLKGKAIRYDCYVL